MIRVCFVVLLALGCASNPSGAEVPSEQSPELTAILNQNWARQDFSGHGFSIEAPTQLQERWALTNGLYMAVVEADLRNGVDRPFNVAIFRSPLTLGLDAAEALQNGYENFGRSPGLRARHMNGSQGFDLLIQNTDGLIVAQRWVVRAHDFVVCNVEARPADESLINPLFARFCDSLEVATEVPSFRMDQMDRRGFACTFPRPPYGAINEGFDVFYLPYSEGTLFRIEYSVDDQIGSLRAFLDSFRSDNGGLFEIQQIAESSVGGQRALGATGAIEGQHVLGFFLRRGDRYYYFSLVTDAPATEAERRAFASFMDSCEFAPGVSD